MKEPRNQDSRREVFPEVPELMGVKSGCGSHRKRAQPSTYECEVLILLEVRGGKKTVGKEGREPTCQQGKTSLLLIKVVSWYL